MRNKFIALVSTFSVTALLGATVALAQNVHLKGGANAEPNFTDGGLFLSASGSLAGLGGGDVRVSLTAQGNVTANCTNPSGANQPPGQNPPPITVTGSQAIPESEIKNGNTPFDVATAAAVSPIPGAPDCPNRRWSEIIEDVSFTSATITVEQPVGTTVLTVNCTFSEPTTNGGVPQNEVSCTSS